MRVSLTFDNGPDADATPHVLDVLAKTGVEASFFLLGSALAKEASLRNLALRARAEGHAVGNHTYSHRTLGTIADPEEALAEIERTQALIGDAASPERLFRPPGGGGHLNKDVLTPKAFEHLRDNQYSCVFWNSVPRDWEDIDGWVVRALGDLSRQAWTVLVLHDVNTGAMRRLEGFIRSAQELGANFTGEFPTSCTPLWRGQVNWLPDMEPCLSHTHD